MLICPKCNSRTEDNATFCPNCGVPFVTEQIDCSAETTVLASDFYQNNQSQTIQTNLQPNPRPLQQMPDSHQNVPVAQLKTNRSFIKTFLLSLITLGIYGLVCYGHITDDVNLVCSRYDGRKSMNYYLLFFLVGPITLEIATVVWMHNICDRIGNELKRRQIDYNFGAKYFWLWGVLGSLIIVGPFIFAHKFFQSVNKINESFNMIG